MDVDPGVSTNRTVYTFVGSPDSVVEGALNGAKAASQLIDMTRHTGIRLVESNHNFWTHYHRISYINYICESSASSSIYNSV